MIAILYIFGYFIIGLLLSAIAYLYELRGNNWEEISWRTRSFTSYLENITGAQLFVFFWPIGLAVLPLYLLVKLLSCAAESYVSKKRASRTSSPANTEES